VLDPILFTMFVNDLPSVVSSPVYMFADDTNVLQELVKIIQHYNMIWVYFKIGQFDGN